MARDMPSARHSARRCRSAVQAYAKMHIAMVLCVMRLRMCARMLLHSVVPGTIFFCKMYENTAAGTAQCSRNRAPGTLRDVLRPAITFAKRRVVAVVGGARPHTSPHAATDKGPLRHGDSCGACVLPPARLNGCQRECGFGQFPTPGGAGCSWPRDLALHPQWQCGRPACRRHPHPSR